MISTIQTPKEIREEGIILKSYYKVLILGLISLLTFSLISSPIHAYGIPFFHFNDSLCSCSAAGSGGSFNYGDWFNQGLNTTGNVSFNFVRLGTINPYGGLFDDDGTYGTLIGKNQIVLKDYNYSFPDKFITSYSQNGFEINNNLSNGIFFGSDWNYGTNQNLYVILTEPSYTNVLTFDTLNNKVSFPLLSGSGSAFACLDENGTLYRSNMSCV